MHHILEIENKWNYNSELPRHGITTFVRFDNPNALIHSRLQTPLRFCSIPPSFVLKLAAKPSESDILQTQFWRALLTKETMMQNKMRSGGYARRDQSLSKSSTYLCLRTFPQDCRWTCTSCSSLILSLCHGCVCLLQHKLSRLWNMITEYILQGVLFFLQASLERSLLFSTFLAPLLLLKATQFGRTLQ